MPDGAGDGGFCLCLPFLLPSPAFGKKRCHDELSGLRHLWPGAGKLDTQLAWRPQNLPFSTAEADAIASEMRALGLPELERMRLLAPQKVMEPEIKLRGEMDALAAFAGTGGAVDMPGKDASKALDLRRRQAQTRLLWQLVLEENLREIASLASRCAAAEKTVAACLHAEIDGGEAGDNWHEVDGSLLPSWQSILASAMFFLPQDSPIFVDGAMRDDLEEILSFNSSPQYARFLGCPPGQEGGIFSACAPISGLPGFGFCPEDSDYMKNLYDQKRTWLIWRKI